MLMQPASYVPTRHRSDDGAAACSNMRCGFPEKNRSFVTAPKTINVRNSLLVTELLGNSAAAEPFLRKSGRTQQLCEQGMSACASQSVFYVMCSSLQAVLWLFSA